MAGWLAHVPILCSKLTFFLLYLQIFKPFKWLKIGIYAGAISVSAFYVAWMTFALVVSTPRGGQTWLANYEEPRANLATKLIVLSGIISLVADIYLLVLPIAGALRLQMTWRRKIGILMLFMTGLG